MRYQPHGITMYASRLSIFIRELKTKLISTDSIIHFKGSNPTQRVCEWRVYFILWFRKTIFLLSILFLDEYSSFSEFPRNLIFMKLKKVRYLIKTTRQKIAILRLGLCVSWRQVVMMKALNQHKVSSEWNDKKDQNNQQHWKVLTNLCGRVPTVMHLFSSTRRKQGRKGILHRTYLFTMSSPFQQGLPSAAANSVMQSWSARLP